MEKMHVKHHFVWLTYTVAVATSVSFTFNVDTTNPHIFTTEQNDFFGTRVLQIISGKNSGRPVTAPQQLNRSEETCKCDLKQTHRCLIIPEISLTNKTLPIKHFGLSIAEDATLSLYTVCSPSAIHECTENSHLNILDPPQQISCYTPGVRECTNKPVDLVFLVDGSASMTSSEFNKNKDFIEDVMNSLTNSSVKFAAVQFSSDYRTVFDFSHFKAGTALDKLKKEPHMKSLTNTHRALRFVLEEIFDNAGAGACPDATKVLVLITDGDPSDTDTYGIINRYNEKHIIRFVIAVGHPELDRFKDIASDPADKYAFKIENYNELTGILENFHKIITMEGTKVTQKQEMTDEMSQSRFSAVFHKVCSPSVVQECCEHSYLNSVCYKTTEHLHQITSFKPAFQQCTNKTVDLVFLVDGSASMTSSEFNKNKDFIEDVMNSLTNSSVKFAAVQFSSDYKTVFDFSHFKAGTALNKLKKEPHMKSLTNTHRALRFVLEEIFDNAGAGACPDATKVLVLITDGDPSDTDTYGIINRYNEKHIIRFVIAVGHPKLDKFKDIASDPADKYAFKIENYDGLTGILENFHKIITMEGTKVARAQEMTDEMSQSRFSAVFHKDTVILGSVGTNSWRGSLHERKPTQTEVPHVQTDSYMGYSIAVGEKNNAPLYFTGAPTFERAGQVVLFRHDCNNWIAAQRINGDQTGSHFGAELCSVDINSDGNTDFLLVGAPQFYQPQEKTEGQIYIYSLTDEMELRSEVNVNAPSTGRFGTTISSVADLNGDGLRDVAVGAPLEDDNRGAVYIYLGDRNRGIRSRFSQRIMGQKIKPGMRFFGQAIDGDVDPGEDGLPNIVVGSQGTAVVLRSRPVFSVLARLSFHPEKINTEATDCLGNTEENGVLPTVTLTACFELVETTQSKAGAVNSGLNISCALSVDPMRQTHRAFFSPTDKTARNLTSTLKLRDKDTCFNYSVYRPKCVDDTLSPVTIRLTFFQVDSETARAVLNVDSKRQAVAEVPFQK